MIPDTHLGETMCQIALPDSLRMCFLGGLGPVSSKRNWVRSLMAYARTKPFRRQWLIVLIETPQTRAIAEIVSIPFTKAIEAVL